MRIVKDWNDDLNYLTYRKDIVAINFGAQKVFNGYEIYLSGHSWFDGNDLWLLDEDWNPLKTMFHLGQKHQILTDFSFWSLL